MEGAPTRKWRGPPFPEGMLKEMMGPPTFLEESYWKWKAPTFLKDSLRKSYFEKWSEVHVCHLLSGERGGGPGVIRVSKKGGPPLGTTDFVAQKNIAPLGFWPQSPDPRFGAKTLYSC